MDVFKYFWIAIVAFFVLLIVRYVVLFARGETEIRSKIKKFSAALLISTVVIGVGTVSLLACFTQFSQMLKDVLSPEFIPETRLVLKSVFGTESVFSSIQILGSFSLLLFGFFSCSSCVYAVCTKISVDRIRETKEEEYDIFNNGQKVLSFPKRKICYLFARNLN